ncbi:MAG: threonine--tRNA ligase, partial [Simkania negevensis]|nr:threonine--tRNA ligase [Simkania negevensis]
MKTFHQNVPLELSSGATAKEAAQSLHLTEPHQGLAVTINDQLSDLSTHLKEGDKLKFYQFEDPEGKEVFWHTSAHVLAQAVLRLYPKALPTIGPPIDHGFYYDFANLHLSEEDFLKVEKEIKTILAENFRPERVEFKNKKEALEAFGKNPYKKELIESFDESAPITAYRQGEFFDLCRGPHLPNIGKIKAFKLLKTSGAYWRGDSSKEMLTRVYAISFPTKEELSRYLFVLEEAKRRDHRLIAAKLDLFSFKEEAHAMPFIHPKGLRIWDSLISYWKELHEEAGYEMIKTPQLLSKELWERSGHWEHYQENMFICQEKEEKSFALKPMNCPGCMLYYLGKPRSYRDLPWRVGEIGHVHRREPSGALNGLFRVQSFHQDDAHIFMKPEDISDEIIAILHLVSKIYQAFGLDHRIELSTRPKKSIGTDRDWEIATKGLKDALDFWGHIYKINEGDGAFYGPKIDFHVQDAIGRSWQCGTIQLDMALPEKFDLHYMD